MAFPRGGVPRSLIGRQGPAIAGFDHDNIRSIRTLWINASDDKDHLMGRATKDLIDKSRQLSENDRLEIFWRGTQAVNGGRL